MAKDYMKLSKLISHALRHEPWLYELELDDEGWVSIEKLLQALQNSWCDITQQDLEKMINCSEKKRHEISGDKIRALYGHSTQCKIIKQKSVPPEILYHGTNPKLLDIIYNEGLKPMNRQYVHLSVDQKTAKQVGLRKAKNPIVLVIYAKKASDNGVIFYCCNNNIWLSDVIPCQYIKNSFSQ